MSAFHPAFPFQHLLFTFKFFNENHLPIDLTNIEIRNKIIEQKKADFEDLDVYENYKYSLTLCQFNCNGNAIRFLNNIDYDKYDKKIARADYEDSF